MLETGPSMDHAILFGRNSRTGSGAGCWRRPWNQSSQARQTSRPCQRRL